MSHVPCDIQGRLWGGREDKLDADIHQEGSDLKKKKKKEVDILGMGNAKAWAPGS